MKYLFILLLVFGCARASNPHTFKTSGFTDSEKESIQLAIDEWASYGYLGFLDDNCSDCSEIKKVNKIIVPYEFEGVKIRSEEQHNELGCTYAELDKGFGIKTTGDPYNTSETISYVIQILDVSSPELLEKNKGNKKDWSDLLRFIALHEIGHTFGKHHLSDINTVMYANIGSKVYNLTEADLEDN
jgi:hypothetical protein